MTSQGRFHSWMGLFFGSGAGRVFGCLRDGSVEREEPRVVGSARATVPVEARSHLRLAETPSRPRRRGSPSPRGARMPSPWPTRSMGSAIHAATSSFRSTGPLSAMSRPGWRTNAPRPRSETSVGDRIFARFIVVDRPLPPPHHTPQPPAPPAHPSRAANHPETTRRGARR